MKVPVRMDTFSKWIYLFVFQICKQKKLRCAIPGFPTNVIDIELWTSSVYISVAIVFTKLTSFCIHISTSFVWKSEIQINISSEALQLVNIGYDIVPIHSPSKLLQYFNPSCKQVFVIDDPIGIHQLNKQKLFEWREHDTLIIQWLRNSHDTTALH
jgi:hypothetical protein